MKARNRRRMNILVVMVLCVVVAGGVFAFVVRGPLVFRGTVTINANIEMAINDTPVTVTELDRTALTPISPTGNVDFTNFLVTAADINAAPIPLFDNAGNPILDMHGNPIAGVGSDATGLSGFRFIGFSGIRFDGPGAARISFEVKNIGTMPTSVVNNSSAALIYVDDEILQAFGLEARTTLSLYATTGGSTNLDDIQPGDSILVQIDLRPTTPTPLPPSHPEYPLPSTPPEFDVEFTVVLDYRMGSSIR